MRLHRLELTAFGPFAQTVEVDFDRLNDASVFLLCGDTGAGKTTVLDGICFALYGDVPGARASARQLRSHHAAETVAPRAVLELTVSGRRFRFTRSPAWQRPKRRGTGTTTEPAHVLVEERVQDAWTLRSNRLDEAGQLVGDLLGMTLAQFSQVVLLPQGQFDTFLRSSSEDRQKVLTRLFQTGRFEQVERWFAERRLDLLREHRRHAAGVAGVVHRLSEAADVPAPEEWDTDDLTGPASSGELRDWADDLVEAARRQGETARRELASAEARREQARAALATARRLAELLDRRRRALADRAALEGDAPAAEADRARLDNARRAATVAPLAEVAADSEAALGRAAERTSAAVLDLADALDTAPEQVRSDDLDAREQETADRLAAARAFLPRAEELRQAEHAQAAALARVDELEISLARSRRLLADLPGRRVELLTELAGLREVAALAGVHESAAAGLAEQLATAVSLAGTVEELASARTAEAAQAARAHDLREQWLAVRERRLDGMAAEIASAMVAGEHCPVCGSAEHPSPALPAPDAPSRADEQEALRRSEDAQVALEAHRDRVRGLRARVDAAREVVGDRTVEELTADLAEERHRAAAGRAAATRLEDAEAELARVEADLAAVTAQVARDEQALHDGRERAAAGAATVTRLAGELAELLDGRAERLEDAIAGHERLRALLVAAREAVAEERRCRAHASSAADRLRTSARAAGFDDPEAALAAHLDPDDLARLEHCVTDRRRREEEVARVLADPDIARAEHQESPDLDALAGSHDRADARHSRAAGVVRVADGVLDRLEQRCEELDRALAAWAPVREEYAVVRRLAELVDGKGPDNLRQMRLSAYVLASRLGQVVAAANERLGRMTDGRYVLEHSAERGAGERRGGLSLVVADQWTDERRDPVTLSGGETFVVSLALALGLADVVTAESGGTRIDTLFVDEGFGSLDDTTLEQVMDALDQLREGGRVVGLVSHVADMRDRIPTQLHVVKGRTGSSLRHVC